MANNRKNPDHTSSRSGFRRKVTPLPGFSPATGRHTCPNGDCGAQVLFYDGKPERHPEGGKKTGKWRYCPAGEK